VSAIESGKVLGACLDVLEYEGLTFENLETAELPEAFSKLINMESVILSPHIAGLTKESSYKMASVILEKIRALYL
jgi:D-3-phosphoglycerate dehydrogenase